MLDKRPNETVEKALFCGISYLIGKRTLLQPWVKSYAKPL
jgi:hypothetical protein